MDDRSWLQREVRALYEITEAINGSLSQQEVLARMLEQLVHGLEYKAATLRLLDEERQTLELKASYGLSETYLQKGPVAIARSQVDQMALAGQRVTIADVGRDPGFQYAEAATREGLASALVVPLDLRDHSIGVLHIYTAEPHMFSAEEQAFLAAIANLGAQAIQRQRLYEAFQTIARHLAASLDLSEVLKTILLESVVELHVKAGSLRLLGPERKTLHLVAAYGLSDTYLQKGQVKVEHSPIDQQALRDARPIAITELTRHVGFQYPEEAQREGIRSVLVLPLRVHDTTIGVLRLYSAQVRRFSADEQAFAATVADLGAVAIENAKLHEALKTRLETLQEDSNAWYRFLAFS